MRNWDVAIKLANAQLFVIKPKLFREKLGCCLRVDNKLISKSDGFEFDIHPERAQPLPTHVQHTHSRKIPGGILGTRTVRPMFAELITNLSTKVNNRCSPS